MRNDVYAVLGAWVIAVALIAGIAGSGLWRGDPSGLAMVDYVDPSRRWPGAVHELAPSYMVRGDMQLDELGSEIAAAAREERVDLQADASPRAVQRSVSLAPTPACVTP